MYKLLCKHMFLNLLDRFLRVKTAGYGHLVLNILRNWQVSKMAAPSTFPLEVYDGPVSSHFCQYLSLLKIQIYFCTCVSVSIKKIPKSGIPGLLFIPIFSFNRTISSQEGLAQFTFNMLAVHNTVHNTCSSLLIWWMKNDISF